MRKKILSLALALAMCLGLMAVPSSAAGGDFVIENGVLKDYKGSGGSVTIPNSVTSIGKSAFKNCKSLTSVTIPNSVTSIGKSAFKNCKSLTSVTISDGVTSIGDSAFSGCKGLTSVFIPSSVLEIRDGAFMGCSNLTSVTISDGVEFIGQCVFGGCESLTSVVIPDSVLAIEAVAFQDCYSLTSVFIPGSVTEIRGNTFSGCNKLTDLYYGGDKLIISSKRYDDPSPTIHYNSTAPAQPEQPQQPAAETTASPTNDKLEVNGNAADPTVYKIGGSNYFKIRDVAALLNGTEKQFAVGYDGAKNAVTATTGQGYDKQSGDLAGAAKGGDQAAAASNDAIYVNGEKITAEVYKINGSNYFKLRDLGKALDFYVGWSAERGMYIETGKPYSE